MKIFVTGTDTGVGKTVITAGIAGVLQSLGYTVGVYKPVQSGGGMKDGGYLYSPDLEFVTSVDANVFTKCSYLLRTPAAPNVSAAAEGQNIDPNVILRDFKTISEQCDFLIVEGAGGISVPVNALMTMKDLIKMLNLPVLVVARPDLGTINHSILTVEYAKNYNLDLLGVVISSYPSGTVNIAIKTAAQNIATFGQVEVLGTVPKIPGLSIENPQAELLIEAILQNIDLEKVFRVKLPKLSQVL